MPDSGAWNAPQTICEMKVAHCLTDTRQAVNPGVDSAARRRSDDTTDRLDLPEQPCPLSSELASGMRPSGRLGLGHARRRSGMGQGGRIIMLLQTIAIEKFLRFVSEQLTERFVRLILEELAPAVKL